MKVSSTSTIPLSFLGLSAPGALRNRCRQRNAVVGCTPQSSAVLARLLPSIIARAWSNQRSLLCRCAIAVLVSALKVRPQLLQRNRESPCERPQATIARPAQMGTALARHALMAARPQSIRTTTPLRAVVPRPAGRGGLRFSRPPEPAIQICQSGRHFPALLDAQPPNARKPDGKLFSLHRIKLLKTARPSLIHINRYRYKRRMSLPCR